LFLFGFFLFQGRQRLDGRPSIRQFDGASALREDPGRSDGMAESHAMESGMGRIEDVARGRVEEKQESALSIQNPLGMQKLLHFLHCFLVELTDPRLGDFKHQADLPKRQVLKIIECENLL